MPRDSDLIMFQHPEYPMDMYGVPTFALGQNPPLLMNRREGDNQYSEEELVRIMGNYAKNLGYVYNPNGLTYGDVNSLMNKSKQFWDDWDGNYQIYLWDDDVGDAWSMLGGSGVTSVGFNINDDKIYTVTKNVGTGNKVVTAKSAETKEASVGMIVRDGDPSSPPSDIFMAEDHPEYGPSAIHYQGPEHYEIVLRKTSTPMSNGEYGFCITKALTPRLDWKATGHSRPRLFMQDDFIMYHRNENLKGLIYDDEIRGYRPMNDAERRLYEGATTGSDRLTGLVSESGGWSVPLGQYTHFQAEDPTQADASNMGGPTTPGNAGVPADVGGDDLVPYDSPSSPPAGVFEADYKTYESRPVRNALFGVAFAVSGLYFWSTAGSVVKNWVVVRVEKYAPKLLEPQFQTMLTLTAFFGIIYFGMKLRGSSKGLTIPSMIDLPLVDA